jgi:acyl carrier protein
MTTTTVTTTMTAAEQRDWRDQLKSLLLQATDKDEPPGGLRDDEPLFGHDARLGFDSMDALQLSMALQQAYGVRWVDSKDTRRAFLSLAHLADTLAAELQARGVTRSAPPTTTQPTTAPRTSDLAVAAASKPGRL